MKTIYPTTIHHGQNIKRLREMLGVKQETIATGLDMTQQAMSKLEQKEQIDDEILEKISKILNIPADAIKNFNDESAINVIANTINAANVASFCHQPIFNPIEKIIELYERLLKTEQEKNALLEKMIDEKKEHK
ncbi:MAG: helix-turn-helix transcriptional regulator [Candidatus Symbiothrix sp.]|jgi:transcriptional regulator with XRE-family HTH domain|nr:helix-turn-helix transcriptional regulator [Candidatus Symbiothrix sp.]